MTLRIMGQLAAVVLLATVSGLVICAAISRRPAGADITEMGSPLYSIAVGESIKGLSKNTDESQDGETCSGCGKVHAAPGTPALSVVANTDSKQGANYEYCVNCKVYHLRQTP